MNIHYSLIVCIPFVLQAPITARFPQRGAPFAQPGFRSITLSGNALSDITRSDNPRPCNSRSPKEQAPKSPDKVLQWNEAATIAVTRLGNGPDALPPMAESRIYAMVNVSMHDALNNIEKRYEPYSLKRSAETDADPAAAVSKAARDVIVALLPAQRAYADSLYTVSIKNIPDGNPKTKGIEIGQASAAAILSARHDDGADSAQFNYTPGTLPGQYRATPPFDGAPFNGFVAVPGWGRLQPFVLTKTSQFRVDPPYPVNSKEYTIDFNEAKALGNATSTSRSAEQKEIALFWLENAPLGWNRIARNLIIRYQLDAWKAAHLLALLQLAEADANIGCFESKYFYSYWRPITAIRSADTDGNPNTASNPTHDVLAPPTPPVPDYPSNHATNGAAAAEILKLFFGNDSIAFDATSSSLPNVTRHYASFSQAADDNALSRIYVGYHFRNAVVKGKEQGRKIGKYVFEHSLASVEVRR